MDTRGKLILDRVVAQPLAWGLTSASWALGRILRRGHGVDPEQVRTIVVAKLLGMGSIIQATPFLHALRGRFPGARLVFLTSAANRALIERLPMIDEAIYLRDGRLDTLAADTTAALSSLARRGVDLYFDLEIYSAGASILALLSLARNRYGFYRHSARFKNGNYTHLVFFNVQMPVSRLYLQLYQATGAPPIDPPALGPITVTDDDVGRMREALGALGLPPGEPYLVVNVNASDLLLERRWPADRFAAAIEALTARGHRVVLIGAPAEAAYVKTIHDRLSAAARERTIDSAGKISLAGVFALLREARCVITNDTGPMHVAIALNRPTVCLFGPGSPQHYGVTGPNIDIRYKAVMCSPCIYETDVPPCDGDNVCMQLIEPAEVVDAALRLLGEAGTVSKEPRRLPILDEPLTVGGAPPYPPAQPVTMGGDPPYPPAQPVRYVDLRGRPLGVVVRSSAPDREPGGR